MYIVLDIACTLTCILVSTYIKTHLDYFSCDFEGTIALLESRFARHDATAVDRRSRVVCVCRGSMVVGYLYIVLMSELPVNCTLSIMNRVQFKFYVCILQYLLSPTCMSHT